MIDVSRAASASIVASRIRLTLQAIMIFGILLLALADVNFLLGLVIVIVAVRVFSKTEFLVPALYYGLTTGHISYSLRSRSYLYYFLSEKDFTSTRKRRGVDFVFQQFGFLLLISAGLSIAYNSDALSLGIPYLYIPHTGLDPRLLSLIVVTGGLFLLTSGMRLEARLRRRNMKAMTSIEAGNRADRPLTLFLREFGTEEIKVPRHAAPRDPSVLATILPMRSIHLEEAITWLCWSFGTVVAISDPRGGREVTVAAAQHPVSGTSDWQSVVLRLMDRAIMVVVIPGESEGIRWETGTILGRPDLADKTIFINPNPARRDAFLRNLGITTRPGDISNGVVVAATVDQRECRPIVSTLAEDVDYEAAVQWQARKINLAALTS